MNDFDLESKLKSVRVPARTEEYWEDFPSRVRSQLRPAAAGWRAQNLWLPRLARAGGYALALALVFVCIQFHPVQSAAAAITKHERQFRAQLAQLDAGLRVIMLNQHGMSYLVSEKN